MAEQVRSGLRDPTRVPHQAPAPQQTSVARRFRGRQRRADLLEAMVWLSTVLVVAIFIADDGISYFLHPAEIPTGLGIVAGLVGSNLVLVMLVQAARVPVIDHAVGYDQGMRMHKKWGQPALILLLAHFGLLLWGYGLGLGLDPLALTQWFFTTGEMVFAYLALGLLALVAATSLVIVRHRLTYRLWFVIHSSPTSLWWRAFRTSSPRGNYSLRAR